MSHPDADELLRDVARELGCTPDEVMRQFRQTVAELAKARERGDSPGEMMSQFKQMLQETLRNKE